MSWNSESPLNGPLAINECLRSSAWDNGNEEDHEEFIQKLSHAQLNLADTSRNSAHEEFQQLKQTVDLKIKALLQEAVLNGILDSTVIFAYLLSSPLTVTKINFSLFQNGSSGLQYNSASSLIHSHSWPLLKIGFQFPKDYQN